MTRYLDTKTTNPGITKWSDSQRRNLQTQILGLLSTVFVRLSHQARTSSDVYPSLNRFISHIIEESRQPTNSRVDISRELNSILHASLNLTLHIAELGPTPKKILASKGVFSHLLNLVTDLNQSSWVISKCLVICSSLCQGIKANKQIFGDLHGVKAVIPYLRYYLFH